MPDGIPSEIAQLIGDEKIRFHVIDGDDRQRSSDWIIWESKGSLYLAVAVLSGRMKLSLHPRGLSGDGKDTQFSTTREYWQAIRQKGFNGPVPFHRWKRPSVRANHVSLVCSVTFPTTLLYNIVPKRKLSGRKIAFPLPDAGRALELSLCNHLMNHTEVEEIFIRKGFTPLFCFELSDGEQVTVAARYVDFPSATDHFPNDIPREALWDGNFVESGQAIHENHAVAFAKWPEDGEPFLMAEINGFSLTMK